MGLFCFFYHGFLYVDLPAWCGTYTRQTRSCDSLHPHPTKIKRRRKRWKRGFSIFFAIIRRTLFHAWFSVTKYCIFSFKKLAGFGRPSLFKRYRYYVRYSTVSVICPMYPLFFTITCILTVLDLEWIKYTLGTYLLIFWGWYSTLPDYQ